MTDTEGRKGFALRERDQVAQSSKVGVPIAWGTTKGSWCQREGYWCSWEKRPSSLKVLSLPLVTINCRNKFGPHPLHAQAAGLIGSTVAFQPCRNMFSRLPHSVLHPCSLPLCSLHKDPCFVPLLQIFIVVSFHHPLLQQGPQLTRVLETRPLSLKGTEMAVWRTFPKRICKVSPISAWVYPRVIRFCFRGLANCSSSFCSALLSWGSLGFCSSFSLSGFTDGSALCPGKASPELALHLGTWLALPLRGLQTALEHLPQSNLSPQYALPCRIHMVGRHRGIPHTSASGPIPQPNSWPSRRVVDVQSGLRINPVVFSSPSPSPPPPHSHGCKKARTSCCGEQRHPKTGDLEKRGLS